MNPFLNLPADAFLAAQPRSKEAPFFIESTFAYKLRRDRARSFRRRYAPSDPVDHWLVRQEWKDLIRRANLSTREGDVVWFRLRGDTFETIGERFDLTRQSAHLIWQSAAAKLRNAAESSPLSGLREVYLAEIRRGKRTRSSPCPSE